MALLRRQTFTYEIFDDQSPALSYTGNWTHSAFQGFTNDTISTTPTPGASLSFAFSGAQAALRLIVFHGADIVVYRNSGVAFGWSAEYYRCKWGDPLLSNC